MYQPIHWGVIILALVLMVWIYTHKHSRYNKALRNRAELPFNHNAMSGMFIVLLLVWVVGLVSEILQTLNRDANRSFDPVIDSPHLACLVPAGFVIVGALSAGLLFGGSAEAQPAKRPG